MKGYSRVEHPFAERFQDNRWATRGAYAGENVGHRRSAPAELPYYIQEKRKWKQGKKHLHNFQPAMYIVRPHDGKRTGAKGRLLDAVTGEGPDVFVVKCGDKRTLMRDRPQRWQWSGWNLTVREERDRRRYDKDFRAKDLAKVKSMSGSMTRSRAMKPRYDFRTRRYEYDIHFLRQPKHLWWTDARWDEGARRSDPEPLSVRNGNDQWWTRVPPNAGDFAGGRPRIW